MRMQIKELKPVLVAEEAVKEVLELLATESTVKAIAEECGVDHQYSDADSAARHGLS